MAKRMLIDATHPEETRVVVLNGNRLEEFDFESSTKKQVKGNIYLAKVTRVEPSLQAAFVEYGGNRHGFLAFSEIHPDYFRIPIGDRGAVGAEPSHTAAEAWEMASEASEEVGVPLEAALPEPVTVAAAPPDRDDEPTGGEPASEPEWPIEGTPPFDRVEEAEDRGEAAGAERPWEEASAFAPTDPEAGAAMPQPEAMPPSPDAGSLVGDMPRTAAAELAMPPDQVITGLEEILPEEILPEEILPEVGETAFEGGDTSSTAEDAAPQARGPGNGEAREAVEAEVIETIGGDEFEEAQSQRSRAPRHYKIQEVVKRRQIMLVQVTKEERGNKGAALTTYLSLAGRYCVLMPNTARGGGVSRKITSISDRRRLKDILEELDIPEGMGVIVRTAGAERSKAEIKRDYEYLLRLWNEIRELTLRSTAPALIYEEGNLIKRSIRDLYTRDIDEVLVEGEEGYRTAKAFMKMLMPSHAKRVQPYRDPQIGLLHRFQVESQIDVIHSPIVQLRSGGYVVINQTEALVAIDVNSGRSTRERNIEETALRTNLEAADEIARQLRLRDLAGLIVIDFIDMEEHRNQGAVERRLKEALKNDRARIQVGRISPFGLLEMSRQRLRPSLVEASTQPCPHCGGTGFIRSTESTALYVLRSIEEEGMRRRSAEVCVYVPTTVALYILNHKRDSLAQLEMRYGVHVLVARDDALIPPAFRLERLRAYGPGETVPVVPLPLTQAPEVEEEEPDEAADEADDLVDAEGNGHDSEAERGRSRRRRRRRRRHEDERGAAPPALAAEDGEEEPGEPVAAVGREPGEERNDEDRAEDDKLHRRRGRRGGRRRGRREEGAEPSFEDPRPASDTVEIVATADEGGPAADEFEVREDEPALAETAAPWPEAGFEPGVAIAVTEIEAASLPAFAGDAMPSQNGAFAAEPEGASPTLVPDQAEEHYPIDAVNDSVTPAESAPPPGDRSDRGDPELAPVRAEVEPGDGYRAEREPGMVAAPATPEPAFPAEAQPEPAEAVQAVTQKPASPRKGWWQRLIQS
jgi:ribonuclease E